MGGGFGLRLVDLIGFHKAVFQIDRERKGTIF